MSVIVNPVEQFPQFPQFQTLLTSLEAKIGKDASDASLSEDLQIASQKMLRERANFLVSSFLMRNVQELIPIESELIGTLMSAEKPSSSTDGSRRVGDALVAEIEDRVDVLASRVSSILSTVSARMNPAILASRVKELRSEIGKLSDDAAAVNFHVCSVLKDSTRTLDQATNTLDSGIQSDLEVTPKHIQTSSLYLQARAEALVLKLSVVKYQMLMDVYGKQGSIDAVKACKAELSARMAELSKELEMSKGRLSQFEGLGRTFNSLVAEYGKLVAELDHTERAIREIEG
eukprot:ANDGO_00540.mRNA.1 hypothetical protein